MHLLLAALLGCDQYLILGEMKFQVNKVESDSEENSLLNELLTTHVCEGFVEIGEEKYVLPIYFLENWEKINQFQVRDDDVFITGCQKTGTTWVTQMIDLIINDFHVDESKKYELLYLDVPLIMNTKNNLHALKAIGEASSPRLIRTHLPWFLLPEQIRNGSKTPKIIHCLRNPKDTCVSYYHFNKKLNGYRGNFEQFCKLFLAGKLVYGSFFATIRSYWEQRERPNLIFVKYADMKNDLSGTIRKTGEFFGKRATDDKMDQVTEYLSFNTMKKHVGQQMNDILTNFVTTYNVPSVDSDFVRVGKEGGYKSVMSSELIEKFDAITKQEFHAMEISLE